MHRRVLMFVAIALASACDEVTGPEGELFRGLAMVETGDPTFPVAVADAGGNALILRWDGGRMSGSVFRRSNGDEMVMWLGPDGRPSTVVVGGHIVLFDNFRDDRVDVGIVSPNGSIEVSRDVAFGSFPVGAPSAALSMGSSLSAAATDAAEAYRFASLTWSWFACGVTVVATAGSGGALAALPVFACGAAIIKTGAALLPSDDPALEATASSIALVGSAVGCAGGDPVSCADKFVASAELGWSVGEAVADSHRNQVDVTRSALAQGFGDVQITLTWETSADLDLWVTGPDGDRIYFGDRNSPTGGQLDRDDLDGFGPENVFWPQGQAPSGEYLVQVDHFSGASPSSYTVLIQSFGRIKGYSGTIRSNETHTIARFQSGQPLPVSPGMVPAFSRQTQAPKQESR